MDVIINLENVFLSHFPFVNKPSFPTAAKRKNFFAIFWVFFKFLLFPFKSIYSQIENSHFQKWMETLLFLSYLTLESPWRPDKIFGFL